MKMTSVEIKDILMIGALAERLHNNKAIDLEANDLELENVILGHWNHWEIGIAEGLKDDTYDDLIANYWTPILSKVYSTSERTLKLMELREKFEYQWGNGGSFMRGICESLTKADNENLVRLHNGFPELTEGYISYSQGKTWEEFMGTK
jgi:hypothetical protein